MKEPYPAWITALFLHLNHYIPNIVVPIQTLQPVKITISN